MGRIKNSSKIVQNVLKFGLFVALVIVIAPLFPHQARTFKYHYEAGHNWAYVDLIAEFDFPIYKSKATLAKEQQDVYRHFAPYYNIAEEVAACQLKEIDNLHLPTSQKHFLQTQLDSIYAQGVITFSDLERIENAGYENITIVNSQHIATTHAVSSLFTPRTAYSCILTNAPHDQLDSLKNLNLNAYLCANLTFDSLTTKEVLATLMASLSETQGMVKTGEVIVRRGEVVNQQTAQKLYSLEKALVQDGVTAATENWSILGNVLIICALIVLLAVYLAVFRGQLFHDFNALLFFSLLMSVIIALACVVTQFTRLSIYIVPFAWIPVIVRVFFDARTALYVHLITTLICSVLAPIPFEFLMLQITMGMVAVSSLRDMTQRAQLVQTAGWILLTYAFGYTAFCLASTGDWHRLDWHTYIYFACNALIVVFAYGLIYIIEKLFHLMSSITLVELNNINSNLMLEFAEKAPGTFQHSMQVSNLAMEAAKQIGANALLVRTGALYHDIGKMVNPQNYTENQQDGINPLSKIDYMAAAQSVISHVTAGVAIAEKHNLPSIIVQFIQMHHGDSKTRYFYNSYKNTHPNETFDEHVFQYPGPKPNTKETAILMMADAVEARSRSMTEYTEESIAAMVDNMINQQMADQQFEETPLTFKDIKIIKAIFTKKLISMNHHRIAYPELKKNE